MVVTNHCRKIHCNGGGTTLHMKQFVLMEILDGENRKRHVGWLLGWGRGELMLDG